MADKWSSIIENSDPGYSAIIDVTIWMGKATLDACVLALVSGVHRLIATSSFERIGTGAFDYDFGALDGADNPLAKSYTNVMYDRQYWSSPIRGYHRINRLSCSPDLRPSGFRPDYLFSSWKSWGGSQGYSHGCSIIPGILECGTSNGTRTRPTASLGNCSIRREKS